MSIGRKPCPGLQRGEFCRKQTFADKCLVIEELVFPQIHPAFSAPKLQSDVTGYFNFVGKGGSPLEPITVGLATLSYVACCKHGRRAFPVSNPVDSHLESSTVQSYPAFNNY